MTNHLKYAMIEVQKAIKADSNNVEAILLRAKLNWVQGKQVDGNMDYWLVHSNNALLIRHATRSPGNQGIHVVYYT